MSIINLIELEKLAASLSIKIEYVDCTNKPLKAFIIKIDGAYYMMIDSTASYEEKELMISHELAHFFTNSLYSIESTDEEIKEKERIANEFMEGLK